MGLDVILGGLVLVAALRGWFKGFVLQAVRFGALIACVYEAGPVRNFIKPHVVGYLHGIRPDLLDRLLWWAACIVSYVVTMGLAVWMIRIYRRRPYGDPDLYRGDQCGGFLLGGAKGLLIALLFAAGIDHYIVERLKGFGLLEQQANSSHALAWTQKYHPIQRIWTTPPVQSFVMHVRQMGLSSPEEDEKANSQAPLQTASRPNSLDFRNTDKPNTDPELDDLNSAIDALKDQLRGQDDPLKGAHSPK